MLKIDNVLIPVDFSDCSTEALRYGLQLASNFGANATVLHVEWTPPPYAGTGFMTMAVPHTGQTLPEFVRDDSEKRLQSMLDAAGFPEGIEIEKVVKAGDAGAVIVGTATDGNFDLIVMGTHGYGALARFFMGSVAQKVVRAAATPVLVVPGTRPE